VSLLVSQCGGCSAYKQSNRGAAEAGATTTAAGDNDDNDTPSRSGRGRAGRRATAVVVCHDARRRPVEHTGTPWWHRDDSLCRPALLVLLLRPPWAKQCAAGIVAVPGPETRLRWLFGDAQTVAGMPLRLPASHTENRWPVARLTANAYARGSPHSYRWPPFLRARHHHRAQRGPC
jgi:hypothetical protein